MTKRWLRATAIAICGGMGLALPLSADEDNEMLEQVAAFTAAGPQGQRLPLTAVTDFEWDTVRGFSGTTPIALYRKALGEDFELDDAIIRELTDDSAVLIFLKDGQVVRQEVFGPPVFLSGLNGEAWDRQHAILVVHTKDPGPYSVIKFAQ